MEPPPERGAARRDDLPEIGLTRFLGQDMVLRKFNVILVTEDTEADWEEMPWLAGQESASSTIFPRPPTPSSG